MSNQQFINRVSENDISLEDSDYQPKDTKFDSIRVNSQDILDEDDSQDMLDEDDSQDMLDEDDSQYDNIQMKGLSVLGIQIKNPYSKPKQNQKLLTRGVFGDGILSKESDNQLKGSNFSSIIGNVDVQSNYLYFQESEHQLLSKKQEEKLLNSYFTDSVTSSTQESSKNKITQNEEIMEVMEEEQTDEEEKQEDQGKEETKEIGVNAQQKQINNNQEQGNALNLHLQEKQIKLLNNQKEILFYYLSKFEEKWIVFTYFLSKSDKYLDFQFELIKEYIPDENKEILLEQLNQILSSSVQIEKLRLWEHNALKEVMFYEKRLCSILYFFSCGVFTKKLIQQIRSDEEIINPKWICICGKKFQKQSALSNHRDTQHKDICLSYLQVQTSKKFGAYSGFDEQFQIEREIPQLLEDYLFEVHNYSRLYLKSMHAEDYFKPVNLEQGKSMNQHNLQ